MDPASSSVVAAELWRPPPHHHHLAPAASGPHHEASSVVTAAADRSNGSRSGAGSSRRRPRCDAPAAEEEPSKLASTSGGAASGCGGQDSADPEAKRSKQMTSSENNDKIRTEAGTNSGNASKSVDKKPAPAEPSKQDYIHVRARRGQATDSHSLAERARREKISERMKVLQDLVPGCNKVIGKASVLDEIINYIQSLQRQVEFLSMKLEAVNAHMNNATVPFPSKDVFRPLLNITAEFTAEDLEAALVTPNETLDDVHMPLLKSIPPVTRMAMGRGTWVTVLCRKLKDWWHWVAEGDQPIVASHGTEIEIYKTLEPAMRLVILKAICDIRVEQEDIRNFIDSSLKHGHDLCTFRKERIGGDNLGISYWYGDDEILGHRLYREIRRVEQIKKEPGKRSRGKGGSSAVAVMSYQWETVASNFDEFDDVAEKLFSSRNRTEVSLGKKLKIEYLPEIEKIHKKKERLLKKQQREALLLDSYLTSDGLTTGRSLRDRKPVTYTFDDFDRSINEAIKITKKRENSAEPVTTTTTTANRRVLPLRSEAPSNGKLNGPSPTANDSFDGNSSKSDDYQESDGEQENEALDRSNRRRKRSQRYTQDFVEAVSDIDPNFDSDDDIMGEAVYDEEYLRNRKHQKASSASEEDEEFRLEEDAEDDDDEEEYSLSTSDDIEEPQRHKKLETRARGRRGTKLRSVDEIQSGLRRSKRSSRPRINYRQYDFSDSDTEPGKARKSDASDPDAGSDAENDMELSTSSQEEEEEEEDDSPDEQNGNNVNDKIEEDHVVAENKVELDEEQQEQPQQLPVEKMDAPSRESESVGRTFLDLNEMAPGGGFDDGPSLTVKDDMDNS